MALLVCGNPTVPADIGLLTKPEGYQSAAGLTAGATEIYRYKDSRIAEISPTTVVIIYEQIQQH
jgi:hypothetical protein